MTWSSFSCWCGSPILDCPIKRGGWRFILQPHHFYKLIQRSMFCEEATSSHLQGYAFLQKATSFHLPRRRHQTSSCLFNNLVYVFKKYLKIYLNTTCVALAPQIVVDYSKCGSRRLMLILSLTWPRWIRTVPFVYMSVISNGPVFGLSIFRWTPSCLI